MRPFFTCLSTSLLDLLNKSFVKVQQCYLPEQTARLGANPEDFVCRCGDQQMFSGGWGEADFQRRIQTGALDVQNTHIYME